MNRQLGWLFAALVVIAAAGGAAGWRYYTQRGTPMARADRFIEAGDYSRARLELSKAVRAQPNDIAAHTAMARVQSKLANPVAAERGFRIAINLGADRAVLTPEIGEAMLVQGHFADVLRLVPAKSTTPALAASNLLLRAAAQLALNDMRAAEATWREAEKVAPGRVEVTLIGARIAAAKNDAAAAEAMADEALRIDPNQVEALLIKEQLLSARNERPAALAMADRAVAAAPWSAMARIDRAYQLMFAGQDDKAQADVDTVLGAQPRFIDAIYLKGVLMARRGQFEDAAIQLANLDSIGPRFPQAIYYQAKVAYALGRKEAAADLARRYNLLVPRDPDGVRLMAITALPVGQARKAQGIVEKAVADGMVDGPTLDLLGRLREEAGDTAGAARAFAQATTASPADADILLDFGLTTLKQGNAADASVTLGKVTAIAPELAAAWEGTARVALAMNDLPKAEAALARLRGLDGETEAGGVLAGLIRLDRDDPDGAQAAWLNVIQAFPASISARYNLARLQLRQGRRRDAMALLQDILVKSPSNVDALQTYLPLLLADGQQGDVVRALETARKADPGSVVLASMLADTYVTTGSTSKAVALLEEFRKDGPLPPGLLGPAARAQAASNMIGEAKDTYAALLKLRPQDMVARLELVALLMRNGQAEAAQATLREALAASPTLAVLTNIVEVERGAKGLDAALALTTTLRNDPANMPYAAALKGDLLLRMRRTADAARAYETEFKAAPSDIMLLRMASTLINSGQDQVAAGYLRTRLDTQPPLPEAAQMAAQVAIKTKRFDEAKTYLALVLKDRPKDATALNNLAWVYSVTADSRAREAAQQAYLLAPSPDSADTLGWIMMRDGAVGAALPLLQLASTQRPGDPVILYHLAATMKAAGRPAEARTVLQRLLESNPTFDELSDARKLLAELAG